MSARVCISRPKKKKKYRNAGQTFVLIIKVKETRYFHSRVIAFWIYLNCIKCGRTERIKEMLLDFAYNSKLSKLICAFLSSIIFYSFLFFSISLSFWILLRLIDYVHCLKFRFQCCEAKNALILVVKLINFFFSCFCTTINKRYSKCPQVL